MRKNLVVAIVLLVNGYWSFAQENRTYEIPFTMDRNLIIVQAQLKDKQVYDFIFDTGTDGIIVSDELAKKIKLKKAEKDTIITPSGEIVEIVENALVDKLSIKNLILSNKRARIMESEKIFSPSAVGIIGMSALRGYLITIDYANKVLRFQKGNLIASDNTVAIDTRQLLEAKIKIDDKEVLAHFDCGAPGYIAIPKRWDNIYKLSAEPVLFGKGRTPMGDFDIYGTTLNGKISVGNFVITNPKVTLLTGDFFYSVNFGYEFFKQYLITIDMKNKLMELKKINSITKK